MGRVGGTEIVLTRKGVCKMGLFRKMQIRIKSYACENRYKKSQKTFVYCPKCNNELISSQSFVSDGEFVTYKCKGCGLISHWDFDTYPVPVLLK